MDTRDTVAYEVFRTHDYNKFSFAEGNRDVSGGQVNKIIDSIEQIGFRRVPIVVNERFEIMDGQGRFAALKKLNLPVDYVIDPGADITVCQKLNIGQTNWKQIDFVKSYASGGNENYQRFLELVGRYPNMVLHVVYGVCFGEVLENGWNTDDLKNGKMKFSEEMAKNAISKLDFLCSVQKELKQVPGNSRFIFTLFGWVVSLPDVNVDRIKKIIVEQYPNLLPGASAIRSLEQLSSLYNKSLKDKSKKMYFDIIYKERKTTRREKQ